MRILQFLKNKKAVRPLAALAAVLIVCGFVAASAGKTAGTKTSVRLAALAATQVLTTSVPLNAPLNAPAETTAQPEIVDAAETQTAAQPTAEAAPSGADAQPETAVQTGWSVSFLPVNDVYYPDLPAFPQMPTFTVSPRRTTGLAGLPICMDIGIATVLGGAIRTGCCCAVFFLCGT